MIIATTGEEITANSTPLIDGWGWDDYWACRDWVEWHRIMKNVYGKDYADSTFLQYWYQQTFGSSAIDCRSTSQSFRDYMRNENLLDLLYDGSSFVKPIGTATDVVSSASNTASNLSGTAATISQVLQWLIPIGLIVLVIVAILVFYKRFTPPVPS